MKRLAWAFLPVAVLVLSGCSFPGLGGSSSSPEVGAVLKSTDGGQKFESKVTIDEKTNIATVDVLSMALNPQNPKNIFLGTMESGMYATDNGGDQWRKLDYPPTKVYGLVIDASNPQRVFATGEYQGRGKIYRSNDAGARWDPIYNEPRDGTFVTALAQDPKNVGTLFAGTNAGVLLKSADGGNTWKNVDAAVALIGQSPITNIVFDIAKSDTVYIVARGKGIFLSMDGGQTLSEIRQDSQGFMSSSSVFSFVTDPYRSGVAYAGTDKGLFRLEDFGKRWTEMNIIESSKKFPIRSVAVNPKNSNEIIYSSALAVYKSIDGGTRWSTYQLTGGRVAANIRYDMSEPSVIYLGLRTP